MEIWRNRVAGVSHKKKNRVWNCAREMGIGSLITEDFENLILNTHELKLLFYSSYKNPFPCFATCGGWLLDDWYR